MNVKKLFAAVFLICLFSKGFGQILTDSVELQSEPKPWQGLMIDLGFNQVARHSSNFPQTFPDIKFWGSRGINIYYFVGFRVLPKFTIAPGVGFGLNSYSFEPSSIRMNNINDTLVFSTAFNVRSNKSKLGVNYIDIPLEFRYQSSTALKHRFRAAIGAKFGIRVSGRTKIKYEPEGGGDDIKVKTSENFHLQSLRFGLTARVGLGYFNIFGFYSLTNLFRTNSGPNVTPIMFGISLSPNFILDF